MEIKPQAVVISKETDHLEKGKYGPIFPKTPACYGFTIIANVKPGRAETIRSYGYRLAEALGALRQRHEVHVPGNLRHRFRQIHRGRDSSLYKDRHQYSFREPRRVSDG